MVNLQLQERIPAVIDGEEVTVYNWVNVKQPAVVRGHNPTVEKFDAHIGAGDSTVPPEYVTHWVAEELEVEFGINVENLGVQVVNVEDDGLQLL